MMRVIAGAQPEGVRLRLSLSAGVFQDSAAAEYAPDQRAADGTFRNLVELPPQAPAAKQVKLVFWNIRPRHAPDAFLTPAARAWVDYPIDGSRQRRFNQTHDSVRFLSIQPDQSSSLVRE